MKTKRPQTNPQHKCIPFEEALSRMEILRHQGMMVKHFSITVISEKGNKITLSFDPRKAANK